MVDLGWIDLLDVFIHTYVLPRFSEREAERLFQIIINRLLAHKPRRNDLRITIRQNLSTH